MLFYLAIGITLVFVLHFALKALAGLSSERIQKLARILTIAGWLALLVLLLRFGQSHIATIAGGLSLLLPWLQQRRRSSPPASSSSGSMTRATAAEILGIGEDANADEIQQAYKRMIQKNHPDQGGSEALARLVNQARDVLLEGQKK
jgi:hypothetical protein